MRTPAMRNRTSGERISSMLARKLRRALHRGGAEENAEFLSLSDLRRGSRCSLEPRVSGIRHALVLDTAPSGFEEAEIRPALPASLRLCSWSHILTGLACADWRE